MENAKVSNKRLMSLAILFVSALEMGGMGLQPALADIAAAFPDIPTVWMQEMSNWPGFAMLLGCALSTLLYATNYNTVEASTAGCAVIHMAGQLGTVCSALFYTPVAGLIKPNDTSFRFLFAACVCAALTLLVALAVSITKKKRAA